MTTDITPIDGLAIIERSDDLSEGTKKYYSSYWTYWDQWCRQNGVNPLDATADHVIQCLINSTRKGPGGLQGITSAVSFVYRAIEQKSPTKDRRVRAARKELASQPAFPLATESLSRTGVSKYKHRLKQYRDWCESHGKPDLPAAPDDIVAFLKEVYENYSDHSLDAVQTASGAVARYHRDNGHANTVAYPEVQAFMAEVKGHYQPSHPKPAGPIMTPEAIRIRELMETQPVDGLEIIDASEQASGSKGVYKHYWEPWAKWSEQNGVDPLDATTDDIIQYMDENPQGPSALSSFTNSVSLVYRMTGRRNPATDPRVPAARLELATERRKPIPTDQLPTDQAGKHATWLRRYRYWFESNDACDLPAEPADIVHFLRETYESYSVYEVQFASGTIARYHRDNGYANTVEYPEVQAAIAELKAQYVPHERKPVGYGLAPETIRIRDLHRNFWLQWRSDHGLDLMDATPAHVCDYVREHRDLYSAKYLRERVVAISGLYEAGADPTDADEVWILLADVKERASTGEAIDRRFKRNRVPIEQMPDVLARAEANPFPPELSDVHVSLIQKARAAHIADSTREHYYEYGWAPYEAWCAEIGISTRDAEPVHVEAYICMMAEVWHPNTVENAFTGIRYFYNSMQPHDNPTMEPLDPFLADSLEGIRRLNPRAPAQMDPIGDVEHRKIAKVAQERQAWEKPHAAILRGAVDLGIVGTMRDGLLRVGEAAKARWCHLERIPDGTGRLTIPTSKTDQTGKSAVVFVSKNSMEVLDGMTVIKHKLGINTEEDDRIFQLGKGALYRRIRNVCSYAGLEGRYGGHSCRIGMAQDLARAGYSLLALMKEGRWRNSATPAYYIRNISVGQGAVAGWYGQDTSRGQIMEKPLSSYGLVSPYMGARFGT